MRPSRTWVSLLTVVLFHLHYTLAASNYRSWYPQFRGVFDRILNTTCAPEYTAYLSGNASPRDPAEERLDGASTLGESVTQCILESTSEFIKANMASSAVLLGIMPVALSVLGSSSEESALLLIVAQRPLLTLLLIAGSPVVVALRPFEYKDPVGILQGRERRFSSINLGPSWVLLVLEYSIALLALANVVHATYELTVGVVTMIMPDWTFLPWLWAGTGILVHFIGACCLASRLRVEHATPKPNIVRSEFTLSSDKDISVETRPERKLFLALSWLTSTSTTFHVIFGTLAFSSMQFISVRDAFGVIGRFTASVTVCRVVVMYELSGLRESVKEIGGSSVEEANNSSDGIKPTSRVITFSP